MELKKPKKLEKGSKVALISLSWGGAAAKPHRYKKGKKEIQKRFDLKVVETPNALKSADYLYNNPQSRLEDLIWCFQNDEIDAIFSIIGGDDSVRMLKYLREEHFEIIRENPKIFLGHSDSTITNFMCHNAGLISYYGPSVLFGFAENSGMDRYTETHVKRALFEESAIGNVENSNLGWTIEKIPWEKEFEDRKRITREPMEKKFIQGKGKVSGQLIGGCMDVMEFIKGTRIWPKKDFWEDKILFLETSEDEPPSQNIKYWLRNYGAQEILEKINGIILGIPGGSIDYDHPNYDQKYREHIEYAKELEEIFLKVSEEFELSNLMIVSRVQFGHIMPMMTLPQGVNVVLNQNKDKITITESGVK